MSVALRQKEQPTRARAGFVTLYAAVGALFPFIPIYYGSLGISLDGIGLHQAGADLPHAVEVDLDQVADFVILEHMRKCSYVRCKGCRSARGAGVRSAGALGH